jgi:hypothetical protein
VSARITVAIPTHDRRETVLLAVRSALAQTRPPERILVLCDGCTDSTAAAVRALGDARVEAVELAKGPGYAYAHRNVPLERADADVVLWLADDDLVLPDHLERIGALFDAGTYELVQTYAVLVHEDDELAWMGADWSVPWSRETVLRRTNTTPMSSIAVRADAARAVGGWDGTVARAADWVLWRRMLEAGARTACTGTATHLHFRASGRVQAWPERVAQVAGWLDLIEDPAALARVRLELDRCRAVAEAATEERGDLAAQDTAAWRTRSVEGQRELAAVRAEVQRAREDEARARADAAESRTAAAALAADRDAARATLQAVYDGGWWRLRGRLRRLAGRGA